MITLEHVENVKNRYLVSSLSEDGVHYDIIRMAKRIASLENALVRILLYDEIREVERIVHEALDSA